MTNIKFKILTFLMITTTAGATLAADKTIFNEPLGKPPIVLKDSNPTDLNLIARTRNPHRRKGEFYGETLKRKRNAEARKRTRQWDRKENAGRNVIHNRNRRTYNGARGRGTSVGR